MTDAAFVCATRWNALTSSYPAAEALATVLWQELEKGYTSPGRYYHTLSHIRYMLEQLDLYQEQALDAVTLQFAIFYHDLVYSIGRHDNEERSAGKAVAGMHQLGVPAAQINKCRLQILATKVHAPSPEQDTNLLTDIDLAVLGEPWPLYHTYTQQIRKEYAVYPDFMYKRGRRQVLEHFLQMPRIYKTDALHEQYEAQARKNMREELLQL